MNSIPINVKLNLAAFLVGWNNVEHIFMAVFWKESCFNHQGAPVGYHKSYDKDEEMARGHKPEFRTNVH